MDNLINRNLVRSTQHRSCTASLISTLESVTEANDGAKSVDVIYLDFSKGYDKVPHKRLITKMKVKGVNEEITKLIDSWLNQRKRVVKVGEKLSEEGNIMYGVLQGMLGLYLFSNFF
jgi:ribonuclease P/MRP protein subunit RPP40